MVWSATYADRAEVLSWLAATVKGQDAVMETEAAGPTFGELADEWLDGVHSGAVGRRRGRKGSGYSRTTLEGYERSLRYVLTPEFGARPAAEIDDREWQTWVDRLSREGLSRSRIANHLAVARAIYGWASRPTRRLVDRNPLAGIELPPNGPVSAVSVTSGKIADRARSRWAATGLEPITLHECRHTYASFLMAAGYTLRELMEYMGHSSLQATERYVKLLPPLDETDPAERLNTYLRRRRDAN
jgi:integrase